MTDKNLHQDGSTLLRLGRVLLASLALGGVLGGCVALVGGAMVGGTMLVVDRRSTGAQVDDQTIEVRAANAILTELYAEADRLEATTSKVPDIGSPTLIVGRIEGGINTNVKAAGEATLRQSMEMAGCGDRDLILLAAGEPDSASNCRSPRRWSPSSPGASARPRPWPT